MDEELIQVERQGSWWVFWIWFIVFWPIAVLYWIFRLRRIKKYIIKNGKKNKSKR